MITLGWLNKIRERLNETVGINVRWKDISDIKMFIEPIIKYGEQEEKRINEGFQCTKK